MSEADLEWIKETGQDRGKPYLWVTWLAAALMGDITCQLRVWVAAHRKGYKTTDGSGSLRDWKVKHTALIEEIVTHIAMERPEARVTLEDENSLTVWGEVATLAGKPDIIEREPGRVHIFDAKTGSPADKDKAQMFLYRWMTRMLNPGMQADLTLVYGQWPGTPVQFEDEVGLRQSASKIIRFYAGSNPPAARPNAKECKDCAIASCPYRAERGMEGSTREF